MPLLLLQYARDQGRRVHVHLGRRINKSFDFRLKAHLPRHVDLAQFDKVADYPSDEDDRLFGTPVLVQTIEAHLTELVDTLDLALLFISIDDSGRFIGVGIGKQK